MGGAQEATPRSCRSQRQAWGICKQRNQGLRTRTVVCRGGELPLSSHSLSTTDKTDAGSNHIHSSQPCTF